jgi:hypothetical protein
MLGPRYATRRSVLGDVSNVTAMVVPEITRSTVNATAGVKYQSGQSSVLEEKVCVLGEEFDWLMFILGGFSVIGGIRQ